MNSITLINQCKSIRNLFLTSGWLVLLFWLLTAGVQAQGVAQVSLSGVPPVLENPSVAAQVDLYEQRQMSMEFIYTSPGITETEFRFRFLVEHEGMPVIDVTSEPVAYRPGVYRYESFSDFPEIEFGTILSDVISQLNTAQDGLINQTGNLAEGAYTITVEPEVVDESSLISQIPAFASFSVRYLDPPILTSPADGSVVSENFPLFSWTEVAGLPAGSMTEYELTIVELFNGQSPGVAIRSNRPVFNDILTNPVFVYGDEQLPLEPGKTYAWQLKSRETVFNIPFTQQGLTEIYTFNVMDDEGYITDRFEWSYPADNPFAAVQVEDARIGSGNVVLDGSYSGTIGDASGGFTFEEFILSPDGQSIDGGRSILDQTVGFEVPIFEDNSLDIFRANAEPPEGAERAVWFTPGFLQIGPDGITPAGMGSAMLRYDGQSFDELEIRFSQDFLIGHGMQITRGQATISDNGIDIAMMDDSGFRFITGGEDLIALLPERLPMPNEQVAWLKLRDEEGTPLVQAIRTVDGSGVAISPLAGETLSLGLEFMDSNPELQVDIQGLVLDPTMQRVISGQVSHIADNENLLEEFGLPIVLEQITYSPEQSLEFAGTLRLFGQTFTGDGDVTLRLRENGRLYGLVNVHQAGLTLPLAGGEDQVVLELRSLVGDIDVHPLSPYQPRYSLDIGADFVIAGSGGSSTRAGLAGVYHSDGELSFGSLQQSGPQQADPAVLELDRVHLSIDRITSLDLTHRQAADFDFNAALDVSMPLQTGEREFAVPLQNVELRNNGLLVPGQNLHEGLSGFDYPPFEVEQLELRLLAMRMEGGLFNWFEWEAGTPSGLRPFFDFEVRFPGFSGRSEELASAAVTLQNAELDEGMISGSLLPYSFLDGGARVPIGGTNGIRVQEITGQLYRNGNQQAVDIDMSAVLHAPDLFAGEAESCSSSAFTVGLTSNSLFEGRADQINLCRTIDWNAVELQLGEGYVDFSVAGGTQTVMAGGDVTAVLARSWLEGADGSGTIELNVLSGEVTDLDAAFTDLTWEYPAGAPVLTFGVNSAALTPDGLMMNEEGHLEIESQQAETRFEGLLVDMETGEIREGEAEILDEFAMKADVSPYRWTMTSQNSLSSEDQNTALLVLPSGQRINRDGMEVSETTAAYAKVNGVADGEIDTEFQDFTLCFSPFNVCSGRVDLSGNNGSIGYINRDGFTFGEPVVDAELPEQLGLPREEIAYLILRSGEQEFVELSESGSDGTVRMRTQGDETVRLVLAGFGDENNRPEVNAAIDVTVNATSFEIVSGQIDLDLTNDPVSLNEYGLPLEIKRLLYDREGDDGNYELQAAAGLMLPGSISDSPVELNPMFTLSSNGFGAADISIGNYSETRGSDTGEQTPLLRTHESPDPVALDLYGLEIKTGQQNRFRFSGDLRSRYFQNTEGTPAEVHFYAGFNENQNEWEFTGDTSHLTGGDLPFYKALFEQSASTPLVITAGENDFGIELAGTMSFPEFGDQFAFSLDRFYIGSDLTDIEVAGQDQELSLFGEFLTLTTEEASVEYSSGSDLLFFTFNGSLLTNIQKARANPESLDFDGFQVGTDGTFKQEGGDTNLLGNDGEIISILGDIFWLDGIEIGYKEYGGTKQFLLTASLDVSIPTPGQTPPARGSITANQREAVIDVDGNVISEADLEFLYDIKEYPELKGEKEPGAEYQYEIPGFATVQTTGVQIDYDMMQPVSTKLKGAFAVHVDKTSSGNTTSTEDSNGNTNGNKRIIHFGKAKTLNDNYGISYSFREQLKFHVNVSGTKDNPLFSFGVGFFNVDLVSVKMADPAVFEVEIGGFAGLTLPQVSGSLRYGGLQFGADGIIAYGEPDGAFSLSVEGIISLSVTGFEYEEQESEDTPLNLEFFESTKDDNGAKGVKTIEKEVRRYLKLTGVEATLGNGAFGAGVERVMYYENMDNDIFFSIRNAEIDLSDIANIWVNLNLAVGATDGDFKLEVAGAATVRKITIGVYGSVRKWEGELSFGIFAASSGINVDLFSPVGAPNAVFLTGVGAGFFYRPVESDFTEVKRLLNEAVTDGGFSYNNPNGFPTMDDLLFAVMLYGEVGIVGGPEAGFAVTGNALLIVTDAFANLDLNAHVLEQTGEPEALGTITANAYLTIGWKDNFLLQGGMKSRIEYPVVDGTTKVDFFLKGQPDTEELLWAATGNVWFTVLNFADISGNFMVNKSGVLVNLGGSIGFDVSVLSVSSKAQFSFWYYSETQNLGVYTGFEIKAKIAGGLAEAGIFVEGALVTENGKLLVFVQGGGYVKIAEVYEGDVNAWASIQKDGAEETRFRGGLGRKKEYEDLITSSKNRSESLNSEARALISEIMDARIADVSLTSAQLQQAGINLRSLSPDERDQWATRMVELEQNEYQIYWEAYDPNSPSGREEKSEHIRPFTWNLHSETFRELADVIVRAPDQPERPGDLPSGVDVNGALDNLNNKFDEIGNKLTDVDRTYDPALPGDNSEEIIQQNPLTAEGPYEFVIDENRTASLQNSFDGVDELEEQYRELLAGNEQVVAAYVEDLQEVNALIGETMEPFGDISEYYARHMSYHKEAYEFGRYLRQQYRQIAGWNSGSNSYDLIRNTRIDINNHYYSSEEDVTEYGTPMMWYRHMLNQFELVQELALENDSLRQTGELEQLEQAVDDFQNVIIDISSRDDYTQLKELVADQYSNLWGSVLIYSYRPYMNWNEDEFDRLLDEHDNFLEEQLLPGYETIVRKMGRIYANLSQMVEGHIALYDSYIDWADSNIREEEKNALLEERRRWTDLLKAPTIQSVSTESHLFERTNHLLVTWEANHPSGELGQNIVQMISNDGYRPPILLSTGSGTEFSSYLFPNNIGENSAEYKFEFAVRGPAGTVTSFNTEWTPYSLGDGQSYENRVQGPVTDAEPVAEPPQQPVVDVPGREVDGEIYIGNSQYIPFTAVQQVQVQTALQYEYAIRNTEAPDEEWLVEWTPVETSTEMPNGIPINGYWADLLGTDEEWAIYSDLQHNDLEQNFQGYFDSSPLEHGNSYELHVRAVNAFGMEGEAGELGFTYDETPPVFESGEAEVEIGNSPRIEEIERSVDLGFREERPEVFEYVPPVDPKQNNIRVQWPEAGDPESGIYVYEVVAGPEDDPARAFENEENVRQLISGAEQTDITVPGALYSDPWYVHVRASNHAQSSSMINSEAQPVMRDVTRPYGGMLQPGISDGGLLTLWEIHPASDDEVSVLGYQYAIGYLPYEEADPNSEGGYLSYEDVIDQAGIVITRPFPEGSETDFEAGRYDILAAGSLAPGFVIDDLDWAQIETPHPLDRLFILVRSVNEQGLTSDESARDLDEMPFNDTTPPVAGEISYEYNADFTKTWPYNDHNGEWLSVSIEGMQDPGSGLDEIEFRLIDPESDEVLAENTDQTPMGSVISQNLWLPGEGIRMAGRRFLLEVTATNGEGLQTEQSAEVDLTVSPIPSFGISASVEYSRLNEHRLEVKVKGVQTNASGLSTTELRVEDGDSGEVLVPWTEQFVGFDLFYHLGESMDFNLSETNSEFWDKYLRISVRVTDGAGQTTTETIYYGRSSSQ